MSVHPLRTPAARLVAVVGIAAAVLWSNSATARPMGADVPNKANELVVEASDYAFTMPDSVAAGRTRIRLVNKGKEMHHMYIVRLEGGKKLADLFAAMQHSAANAAPGMHGALPAWTRDMGGPNTPIPGGESGAIVDLAPGTYAVLCVIPSPDGKPHVMKGMAKELTVVAGRPAHLVDAPAPTVTMTLTDYAFELDKPLTAGQHTIRVVNEAATQSHEVLIARLAPGKTAHDLLAWVEKMDGPPPGMPLGGTVGLAKGVENLIPVNLEPGEYALLCFLPDHKDGKPHVAHGMFRQITVK